MHRFFITPEELKTDEIVFSTAHARQISRVLRLKNGERCVVLDNQGNELLVELTQVEKDSCTARIVEKSTAEEPRTRLLLLLSLTQREKFEWMLQKCTEIGASAFQPVITSRSLVQNLKEVEAKYERWRMIIREAAEQSGRGRLPDLLPATSLAEAAGDAVLRYNLCLIPWEGEKKTAMKDALRGKAPGSAAVLIGPEGGFSDEEVQQAENAGFKPVTLGKRILRMETAAMVTAALIFHELE